MAVAAAALEPWPHPVRCRAWGVTTQRLGQVEKLPCAPQRAEPAPLLGVRRFLAIACAASALQVSAAEEPGCGVIQDHALIQQVLARPGPRQAVQAGGGAAAGLPAAAPLPGWQAAASIAEGDLKRQIGSYTRGPAALEEGARPAPAPPPGVSLLQGRHGATASEICEDQHTHCAGWAKRGECKENPRYMLFFCRTSCNVCGCTNKNAFCSLWERVGECTRNPSYMLNMCMLSCGQCPGVTGRGSEAPAPTPAPIPAPTPAPTPAPQQGYVERSLVADEGNNAGDMRSDVGVEECKRYCDALPQCQSFSYSAESRLCYPKAKAVTADDAPKATPHLDYKTWYNTGQGYPAGSCKTGVVKAGDKIFLQAHTGKRITVEPGGAIHAQWDDRGTWQGLVVESEGDGEIKSGSTIWLKAHTGNYITTEGDVVHALWDHRGDWQAFAVERDAGRGSLCVGDRIFLRAHTGKRLVVHGDAISATATSQGNSEAFSVEK